MDDLYEVTWYNMDGERKLEYFTTREKATKVWGDICGELSWVHIWLKPEMGIRAFLQQLPLEMVTIIKI